MYDNVNKSLILKYLKRKLFQVNCDTCYHREKDMYCCLCGGGSRRYWTIGESYCEELTEGILEIINKIPSEC